LAWLVPRWSFFAPIYIKKNDLFDLKQKIIINAISIPIIQDLHDDLYQFFVVIQ